VAKDEKEAVKWYRKAADQGHPWAQNNLGLMYLNSWGVERDYTEALRWLRMAAAQNNPWGQGNIGVMYRNGLGVPKDEEEAVRWFRKSAAQNNAWAHDLGDGTVLLLFPWRAPASTPRDRANISDRPGREYYGDVPLPQPAREHQQPCRSTLASARSSATFTT
jgi:hypothetical protein